MSYTQEQLAALKRAYALGALSVEYAGQRVTYRSRAEMKAIIDEIETSLNPAASFRTSYVQHSRD